MGSCSSKPNEISPTTSKDHANATGSLSHESKTPNNHSQRTETQNNHSQHSVTKQNHSQHTKRFKNDDTASITKTHGLNSQNRSVETGNQGQTDNKPADTANIIKTLKADSQNRSVGQKFGRTGNQGQTDKKTADTATSIKTRKVDTQQRNAGKKVDRTGNEGQTDKKTAGTTNIIETRKADSQHRSVEQQIDRTGNQGQTDKKTEKLTVRNADKLIEVTIKTTLGKDEVVADITYMSPEPPKLRKKDLLKGIADFSKIDQHAREAPPELTQDIPDLVGYLSIPSKDPLFLIRAIFVWVAYNIDYDADGYFGRAEKSQCDSNSVLQSGKSVCEGYANVIQEMCKQAGIAVKKLSGFAKGFSHSNETRFTTDCKTNHAWNAVSIRGSWFLLDSTWGAGNVNRETKQFVRKFNEFYFLTDPEHFIYSHYPICKGSVEESLKWQLLDKPFSLKQFNDAMKIQPAAFDLGLLPSSHKESVIEFADEVELAFRENVPKSNKVTMNLYLKADNKLHKEEYCCFAFWTRETLNMKVKPPKTGTYELKIYGRELEADTNESSPQLFSYSMVCHVPDNVRTSRRYPYPEAYAQAFLDDCEVIEPLGKQLLPHSSVKMRFRSPHLKRMMIKKTMLEKQGKTFEGTVMTPESGDVITVYGSRLDSGSLKGLFKFCVG